MTPTPLRDRVAVITGASSGIGAALARQLHGEGARLGLLSRSGADLEIPGAVAVACDVRSAEEVQQAYARIAEELGEPDVVVANAGVGHYADFVDTPLERSQEMVDTNLMGTINLYHTAVPRMLAAGVQGDLVTVASEAGRRGFPGEAVYCASKFGQVGLSRALDGELREKGIRVTVLCPGGVHTEFAVGDGRGRSHEDPNVQAMMTAEDVADLAVYALTRPRSMRLTEIALRPVSEAIWG